MKFTLPALVACLALLPANAFALKVDIGPDNGRKDVLTPEAENWVFKDAPAISHQFGPIACTLRSIGTGQLSGVLWKGGLDTGATLATDGVTIKGGNGTLELTITGLSPGPHTLVTYHNLTENIPANAVGHLTLSLNGQTKITNLKPSVRASNDDDAATAFLEFDAVANTPVVVSIKYDGAGGGGTGVGGAGNAVILNGFELDTVNPLLKALKPTPAHNDEHAIENPTLTWSPSKTAISHDIYLGTDPATVATATHASPEFKGNQKTNTFATQDLDPWLTYFWRVDEINADSSTGATSATPPTHGDTWRFRIRQLAFPGAEGYGRFARGGRGGKVYAVTTLADSGPGSLREAVEATGPRIIVFRVGGTIDLKSKLVVANPYCTIAGQTAPGDGILLAHYTVAAASTHDVILRYLRIRISDETGETLDGAGFANCDNCIMDHCSISWSIDEAFSSRSAKNITLQRTIISEALNMSVHSHYVGTGKGHSFAGSISGDIGSFHHNLLVNDAGRNWSLAGGLSQGGQFAGRLDIRNNVVYNWYHRTTDGGVKELDYVNNFYIPGPATLGKQPQFMYLIDPDAGIHPNTPDDFQRVYMSGNMLEGHPEFDSDNWKGALFRSEKDGGPGTGAGLDRTHIKEPMFPSYVKTDTALDAYKSVIADVGANIPHYDSVDARALHDVTTRSSSDKGSKTDLPGIIDSQSDAGGFPTLKGGNPLQDTDHDGIPDAWEISHHLNPNDPTDAPKKSTDGYSNLELYLNSIRPDGK